MAELRFTRRRNETSGNSHRPYAAKWNSLSIN